jgi:hypothetical protein
MHYDGPDVAIYAEPYGNCEGNRPCFSEIQYTINESNGGTLIKIDEGTYTENVVIEKKYF